MWVGWCAHTHTNYDANRRFKSGRPHHEGHTHTKRIPTMPHAVGRTAQAATSSYVTFIVMHNVNTRSLDFRRQQTVVRILASMKRRTDNSLVLVSMLLVSLMMLSVSMPNANAASVGPNSPGTVVSVSPGDYSWSNPDNAKVSDNSYASATTPLGFSDLPPPSSYRLKATSYGFDVPSGATVRGIQVDVERDKGSQTAPSLAIVKDMEILIVKSDGSLGTSNKADTATNWPTSDSTKSYGGATDLWGEVWSPADINNPNFGVVVRVSFDWNGGGPAPSAIANVDYVSITVYYDPPPVAPVGGFMEPVNKLAVFAPYLALLGVLAVIVIAAVPWKKRGLS